MGGGGDVGSHPPPPPQSHSKSNQLIASANQVWWNSIKLYLSYRVKKQNWTGGGGGGGGAPPQLCSLALNIYS